MFTLLLHAYYHILILRMSTPPPSSNNFKFSIDNLLTPKVTPPSLAQHFALMSAFLNSKHEQSTKLFSNQEQKAKVSIESPTPSKKPKMDNDLKISREESEIDEKNLMPKLLANKDLIERLISVAFSSLSDY